MLNWIRDTLKYSKWILMLIIASFILFYGVSWWDRGGKGGDANWVARVDGQNIDPTAWQVTSHQLEERYRQQFGNMYDQVRKSINVGRLAAEKLIQESLIVRDARRLGLSVSDDAVAASITSMPGLQQNGQFIGAAAYQKLVRAGAFGPFRSAREFENAVRQDMLIAQWRGVVAASATVSKDDVAREFRRRHERTTFEYLALPLDKYAASVAPSDADLQAWFNAHPERFGAGEARKLAYVLFDEGVVGARAAVKDSEIQDYYNANAEQFNRPELRRARHILVKVAPDADAAAVEAAQKKAQSLADQARAGADFAKLAEKNSDDPGSKEKGGDLGLFKKGSMVPEFDDVVFSQRVGVVSDPVKTQFGFHVIKVEEIQPGGEIPLAAVKDQIRAQLRAPRVREVAMTLAQEFRKKATDESSFRAAAAAAKVAVQDAGAVLAGDPMPFGPAPELVAEAFALKKGDVTGVDETQQGAVVAVVLDVVKDYKPTFASRRAQVDALYRRERAGELAKAELSAAVSRAGGDLEKAAKELKLEVKKTEPAFARGTSLPGVGGGSAIDAAVFNAPVGSVSQAAAGDGGAIIAKIQARSQADMSQLPAEEGFIREALQRPLGQQVIAKRIEELRRAAKIELNTTLFQRS